MKRFDISMVQPRAWSILSRSFRAGKIASTYLFHGPEGQGHWPLAVSLAALLNCVEPKSSDETKLTIPCGECQKCRQIFALGFEGMQFALPIASHKSNDQMVDLINAVLDDLRREPFHVITSQTPISIPINLAREIKRSLSRMGSKGVTRVAMFHNMERMKVSSADALLKLIEEPPADTVIILTAGSPEALLPTIQSRSQKIKVERVPEQAAVDYLMSHYQVTEERAQIAVRIAEGNIGRSIAIIDDAVGDDGSQRGTGFWLYKSLFTESNAAAVALSLELVGANDRGAVERLLRFWQSLIRDCGYYAQTGDDETLVNIDFAQEIRKLARFFEDSSLASHMTGCIKNALAAFELNVHIPTTLAALMLKMKSRLPKAAPQGA